MLKLLSWEDLRVGLERMLKEDGTVCQGPRSHLLKGELLRYLESGNQLWGGGGGEMMCI